MTHIDENVFETLKSRMKEKFPILLEGYLRDARRYMVIIETNLDDCNLSEIIDATHSLKSASGLLGVINVHEISERLEYKAKEMHEKGESSCAAIGDDYAQLQNAFSFVQDDLQKRCARLKKEYQSH